jgi:hypothetical protein
MACVYVLHLASSPDDVRYVGMTKHETAEKRFKIHLNAAKKPRKSPLPVYDWMRKYEGQVAFTTIADSLTLKEAQDLERSLIISYRSTTSRLLNCNDGGDGAFNPTPETRKKIGASRRGKPGKPNSPEARAKISKALKGREFSDEWRQKLSEAKKGKTLSEAHKKNLSAAHVGIAHTEEAKKKMSDIRKTRREFTPEERAEISRKISESRKGKPSWNKGKSFSPEARKNMSDAAKLRRSNEKKLY